MFPKFDFEKYHRLSSPENYIPSPSFKTFYLSFKGYFSEDNRMVLPKYSGIYCIYSAVSFGAEAGQSSEGAFSLRRLLFIGASGNLSQLCDDDWSRFKSHLNSKEVLCFSFSECPTYGLERVQTALVFRQLPLANERVLKFSFDETMIVLNGKAGMLPPCLIIRPQDV